MVPQIQVDDAGSRSQQGTLHLHKPTGFFQTFQSLCSVGIKNAISFDTLINLEAH